MFLPVWAGVAVATPLSVSFTSTTAGPAVAGDTIEATLYLNDSVSFNTLDAMLSWDNVVLVPINQVSSDHFLTLGSVFAGSSFAPVTYDSLPGDSSITISLVPTVDPVESANGPGVLFMLSFQVRTGIVLPAATSIQFNALDAPSALGAGLALYQIYDQNGGVIDPELAPWVATPQAVSIALRNQGPSVPEPGSLMLMTLGAIAMGRFIGKRRS